MPSNCTKVFLQVQRGTELSVLAIRYLDQSQLIPDDILNELVSNRLQEQDTKQDGYVLDGYPHNEAQASLLELNNLTPDKACTTSSQDTVCNGTELLYGAVPTVNQVILCST